MNTIAVRDTIHIAHRQPGYGGECRFVHGASLRCTVAVSCDAFPRDGAGVSLLADHLLGLLRRFDHHLVVAGRDRAAMAGLVDPGGIVEIDGTAPTAENLAAQLARDVARHIRTKHPDRAKRYTIHVTVAESEDAFFAMSTDAVI